MRHHPNCRCDDLLRGAKEIRIAMIHAQRAAMRNGHKPGWRNTSRVEREEKVMEETQEAIDSLWDVEATPEDKLGELGDAIWSLVMMYDNEGLLNGEEEHDV
jgi:NTP pyrophosphatase (non-canonical NTP hydrolase)